MSPASFVRYGLLTLPRFSVPSSSRVQSVGRQCYLLSVLEASIFRLSWVCRRACAVLRRVDARPRSLLVPSQPATFFHGTVVGRILALLLGTASPSVLSPRRCLSWPYNYRPCRLISRTAFAIRFLVACVQRLTHTRLTIEPSVHRPLV